MTKQGVFIVFFATLFIECHNAKPIENNMKIDSSMFIYSEEKIDVDCEKCNIDYVREIKMHISNLDTLAIINFLCTIDESCSNKVEFSQFSNKVLFLLLLEYPDLTVELLAKYDFHLDRICNKLAHPIHDGIDVDGIATLLKKKDTHKQIREKLLHALPGN